MALWALLARREDPSRPMDFDNYPVEKNACHRVRVREADVKPIALPDPVENVVFEWRRAVDGAWREREERRLVDGTYRLLPASWRPFTHDQDGRLIDRFPHVSSADADLVAYTVNADKGEVDTQTKMKPGRYLQLFHPELSMELQRSLVADLAAAYGAADLHFTQDPDEIVEVYKNGPRSCMGGHRSDDCDEDSNNEWNFDPKFVGFDNPTFVYGNGDLAIAYLGNKKKAKARCVVWPEKKIYGRCYGYEQKLSALLEAAGYEDGYSNATQYNTPFAGARLRLIPADEGHASIVMPYVDVAHWGLVSPDYQFVVLANREKSAAADDDDYATSIGNLMHLHYEGGAIPVRDDRPRCGLSNVLLEGQETVTVDDVVATLAMALNHGCRLTKDGIWTGYYHHVYDNDRFEWYSRAFMQAHREDFIECAMTSKSIYKPTTEIIPCRTQRTQGWTSRGTLATFPNNAVEYKGIIYSSADLIATANKVNHLEVEWPG